MEDAKTRGTRLSAALAEVVRQARYDARIDSVRKLAQRAGMTHTMLNARLSGKTPFNAYDLGALSVPLGVSPTELVRRAQDLADAERDDAIVLRSTKLPLMIIDDALAEREPD